MVRKKQSWHAMRLLKNIICYQLNEYLLSGPKRNIEFCFPESQSVWSVFYSGQLKNEKKIAAKIFVWRRLTQICRGFKVHDHVQVESSSCCFLRGVSEFFLAPGSYRVLLQSVNVFELRGTTMRFIKPASLEFGLNKSALPWSVSSQLHVKEIGTLLLVYFLTL